MENRCSKGTAPYRGIYEVVRMEPAGEFEVLPESREKTRKEKSVSK